MHAQHTSCTLSLPALHISHTQPNSSTKSCLMHKNSVFTMTVETLSWIILEIEFTVFREPIFMKEAQDIYSPTQL